LTHAQVQSLYIHNLQYNHQLAYAQADPSQLFNPYVLLIHDRLNMNAYGFSVDDAVGFMSELGTGLIFTVGGTDGLENQGKFSYANGFTVVLGRDTGFAPNQPLIKRYGACSLDPTSSDPQCLNVVQNVTTPTNSEINGFRIGTVTYPVRIRFTDLNDNIYTFLMSGPFVDCAAGSALDACPANKAAIQTALKDPTNCIVTNSQGAKVAKSDQWCSTANPNQVTDPNSKDPQTTKNYMSFGVVVNALP
jgi:hypothetical protein